MFSRNNSRSNAKYPASARQGSTTPKPAPAADGSRQDAGTEAPVAVQDVVAQQDTPASEVRAGAPVADAAIEAPQHRLLEVAAANGSFVRFGQAVEKAGLSETLGGDGPFTVFAPTDKAFDRLPAGKLDQLFDPANKDELASLVNYHILKGRRSMADVGKWQSARTLHGQSAPIEVEGTDIRIDGAQVLFADIASANGVIHGIDTVNTPVASATTVRPVNGTVN